MTGTAFMCHPEKIEYVKEISKGIGKMFFMHGKTYNENAIINYTEALIETYKYETPETILLFLKKAANGDFGKFFGEPDIGTIREWFADFLQQTIIPARERANTIEKEHSTAKPGQSAREYLERGGEKPATKFIQRFISDRR